MLGGAIATSTPTIASSFGPRSSPVTRSSQIAQSNPPRSSQMAQSNLPHSPLDFGKVYGPPTNQQRQPSHAAHPGTGGGGTLHPSTSAVAMGTITAANPMLSSMTANATTTTTTTGNHRKAPMLARKTSGAWPIASTSSSSAAASTQLPPSTHPTPTLTSMEHMRTLALGSFRPMTITTAPPPSAPTHQLQTVTTGASLSSALAPVARRIWTGHVGSSGPGPNEHSELSSPSRFPPVATAATKPYVGSHPPSEQPTLADSNNYHNQSNNNNNNNSSSNGHPQEEAMTMATAVMPQPTTLQVTDTLVVVISFFVCCFLCSFVCLFNESSIPLNLTPRHPTDRSMRTSCLPVVLSFAPSSLPILCLLLCHYSPK